MIRNEMIDVNQLNEEIQDLEYSIAITLSGLNGCEDRALFEQLTDELMMYRTDLAKLKDTNGL